MLHRRTAVAAFTVAPLPIACVLAACGDDDRTVSPSDFVTAHAHHHLHQDLSCAARRRCWRLVSLCVAIVFRTVVGGFVLLMVKTNSVQRF
jgi:hypothetical protein